MKVTETPLPGLRVIEHEPLIAPPIAAQPQVAVRHSVERGIEHEDHARP